MTCRARHPKPCHDRVERTGALPGQKPPGQTSSAEHRVEKRGGEEAARVKVEKTQVEVRIVGNDDCGAEKRVQLREDRIDAWLIAQHCLRDACQPGDRRRHPPARVHQSVKLCP